MTVYRHKLAIHLIFTRTLKSIVLTKRSYLIVRTNITPNTLEIRSTDALLFPTKTTTTTGNILVAIALTTLPTYTVIVQVGRHLSREVVRNMLLEAGATGYILRAVPVHRTQAGPPAFYTALEGTIFTSKPIVTLASTIVLTHTVQPATATRAGTVT
tara:strand:+ start:440 stop:910 length:471 start_codon:yes stop_codon:yes gene_type:complete